MFKIVVPKLHGIIKTVVPKSAIYPRLSFQTISIQYCRSKIKKIKDCRSKSKIFETAVLNLKIFKTVVPK